MTTKSKPKKFIHCVILLTLLSCVDVTSLVTGVETIISSSTPSHRTRSVDLDNVRVNRRLRTTGTIAKDNYAYEDRAISGITKIKDVTQAGTKKLQKLAQSAKHKVTSNNHYTTDKRFVKFKVAQEQSTLFESAQFEKWASAVTKAYKKNPEAADVAMVSTLTAHYGDHVLATMLAAAKQVPSTKTTAIQFEKVQLNSWMASKKKSDDVFKLLKLDEQGSNLLKSPTLGTWMSYVSKHNENPYDVLLRKLIDQHGDAGVAKILIVSKNDAAMRAIAKKLRGYQLEKWRKTRKPSSTSLGS